MKRQRKCGNYWTFFILGIALIPIAIATENMAFLGVGVAFIAVALVNRDRWNPCVAPKPSKSGDKKKPKKK